MESGRIGIVIGKGAPPNKHCAGRSNKVTGEQSLPNNELPALAFVKPGVLAGGERV